MIGNDKQKYLYSVGGRIKFGENAQEAIKREVLEEIGLHMEVDRLGFIQENYFVSDSCVKENKLVYEISFYFYMKMPEEFESKSESLSEDGSSERLVWVNAESEIKFYPEFFRTELKNPCNYVKHIYTDER